MNLFEASELKDTGVFEYGFIKAADIVFGDEIRQICESNGCGSYGSTWACPPAVGTLEECREKCLSYANAMVFSSKYPLEDSFDIEGMREGHRQFKDVCDRVFELTGKHCRNFLLLSNESCCRCKECTYPDSPCRYPERLFPAVEGFGIYVNQLAKSADIHYINGENTVTYIGMLLF